MAAAGIWPWPSHRRGNGFASQSDILINTRWAADLLGATRMDRLDGIATNPGNGKVYCVMTHTSRRTHEQVAPVNRRGVNRYGHLIECTEDSSDCTAETFTWALLLFCGESSNPADGAYFTGVNPRLGRPVSSPGKSPSTLAATYGSRLPVKRRRLGRTMAYTPSRLQDWSAVLCISS